MATRTQLVMTDFSLGEVSPRFKGRYDLEQYPKSLETCENFSIIPLGGAQSRDGSIYKREVKDSTKRTRMIPFYTGTQTYLMEIGEFYIRPLDAGGNRVQYPLGTDIEWVTTYTEAEVFQINYAQIGNALYLVHESHYPKYISSMGWTFLDVPLIGPFQPTNYGGTMTPSGTTGNITVTSSTSVFLSCDVGSTMKLNGGYVKITSLASAAVANATVISTLTGIGADSAWLISWFNDVVGPATVTFFERRCVFGSTPIPYWIFGAPPSPVAQRIHDLKSKPITIWGSVPERFNNFTGGTTAGDSYEFVIGIPKLQDINWLVSIRTLVGGGALRIFKANGFDSPLSPVSVDIKNQVSYGAEDADPITYGNFVIFKEKNGPYVRVLNYANETDIYEAVRINPYSEHIGDGKTLIEGIFNETFPQGLMFVRSDGQIVGCAYSEGLGFYGWYRHVTDGLYESICAIPLTSGAIRIWAVVKRTINGATVRNLEYFDSTVELDCAISWSGAVTPVVSGLSTLEGKLVGAVATNGEYLGTFTVSGGQITLPKVVASGYVGLPFTSTIKTMPVNALPAAQKRFADTLVRVYNSRCIKINNQDVDFIEGGSPTDSPPPIFSGMKRVHNLGWDSDAQVTIVRNAPYKLTVLSVSGRFEGGD